MSYILDALKKSAAERERGITPGLHTQTMGQAPEILVAARHAKMAFYGVMGLALLLLSGIFWLLLSRPLPIQVSIPPPPTPAPTALLPSLPKPALLQAEVSTPQPEPVTALVQSTDVSIPSTPEKKPQIVAKTPAKTTAITKPKPPLVNTVTHNEAAATPTAVHSANEPRIYAISELPDDIRTSLPKLAISGAVYANTPANRMLIVSGQIYHESDEPAPGLQVEQIRPKEAIFKYQGYRYRQSYP